MFLLDFKLFYFGAAQCVRSFPYCQHLFSFFLTQDGWGAGMQRLLKKVLHQIPESWETARGLHDTRVDSDIIEAVALWDSMN